MESLGETRFNGAGSTAVYGMTKSSAPTQHRHTADATFFEYSKAANPFGPELTPTIPYHVFPQALYADGPSRVVPLDLSRDLRCEGPATGPGLCAHFVRVLSNEALTLEPQATSVVLYVIDGEGQAVIGDDRIPWRKGDFLALPGKRSFTLKASQDAALYYVNDAPLLRYLGVEVARERFKPTLYPADRAEEALQLAVQDPNSVARSRTSVLLGNVNFARTRTVTHVLWAMYGIVKEGTMQKPHRHQSIALDYIVDADPGCYTLVGRHLGDDGHIVNATRVDWHPGSAFVTPPGYWHAHFNESGRAARIIPIQDAGLQTYLRSLDIRFT